jgi:DNA polymerase III epsilon subunit-like protein
MKDLCFIDIETTGAIFDYHEIIEIGAIRTSLDCGIIGRFEKKLCPEYPERITSIARKINNYNAEDWKDADPISIETWKILIEFWGGCIPVCHNPSFERAFITLAALNHQIEDIGLDYHWIGTESLAWHLYVNENIRKLSLSAIAEYFGIEPEPYPHTAINGAYQCREVYRSLINSF